MALLHPIYYELTSGFMVRKALRRNALRGRNDIPWFLSIVHATVHSVSVSAIMTSSIDSLAISVLTQVLFSAVRLVWRTTTDWRDMQFERLLHWDWRWQPAEEDRITQVGGRGPHRVPGEPALAVDPDLHCWPGPYKPLSTPLKSAAHPDG
ncbi:uncharacterized protein HaLaN_03128 [Haematococcus lacustris]|uniref:Uncharacterized protein n=1 Tax=Haematococcus lacustris TaxID=44745 RepID=A0A699YFG7_HAELA|nr:uncharacterized protein HaLaN_03128 [Haematococcus lacustris]